MRACLHVFFNALAFFTRLPGPSWVDHGAAHRRRAPCCAPLVGWIVGALGALVFAGADLMWPLSVAVLASTAATVWVTGALHEDGLADFCDGVGGGRDREHALAIMKDSRLGTFGALALVLALLLKLATLHEIAALARAATAGDALATGAGLVGATLLAGHALSRFAAVSVMRTHAYVGAGPGSKSTAVVDRMSVGGLLFAGACGLLPLAWYLMLGRPALALAAVPALLGRIVLGRWLAGRFGGYTGDCLGAVQQATELLFYLAVCVGLRLHGASA